MYPPLIPVLIACAIWIICFLRPDTSVMRIAKKYNWVVLGIVLTNYVLHFFI
jgi:hypothetical protein